MELEELRDALKIASAREPENVMPPFFPKNTFWLIAICRISSGGVGVPPFASIVSGLAQYRQRNGQPCRKTTSRRPGPSNVPILS